MVTKKARVIMLPNEKVPVGYLNNMIINNNYKQEHLYITTDDEIKELPK